MNTDIELDEVEVLIQTVLYVCRVADSLCRNDERDDEVEHYELDVDVMPQIIELDDDEVFEVGQVTVDDVENNE